MVTPPPLIALPRSCAIELGLVASFTAHLTALAPTTSLTSANGSLHVSGEDSASTKTTSARILRVFRALRVLRAFKLSHVWEPLNRTLQTMYRAFAPVASLALLILLFTLMFALLGKVGTHAA